MTFYPFADTMGIDSRNVPADPRYFRLVALYATGTGGIAATAAEIARFRDAGVGVIMIDQTAELDTWKNGWADVADVEEGAGTFQAAAAAAKAREGRGWQSTIYLAESGIPAMEDALRNAGATLDSVRFGVANWSLSQAEAENLLAGNPGWAYVQWASPTSNPLTAMPGEGKDLQVTNADLDIASEAFGSQFLPAPLKPSGPAKLFADGRQSLAQFAQAHQTTPEAVIWQTAAGHPGGFGELEARYFGAGNWSTIVPEGTSLWVPACGATGQRGSPHRARESWRGLGRSAWSPNTRTRGS